MRIESRIEADVQIYMVNVRFMMNMLSPLRATWQRFSSPMLWGYWMAVAFLLCGADPMTAATLTGRVLDAITRQPIRSATIGIVALRLQAGTDSIGRFRIEGIPAGEYRVIVRSIGRPNTVFNIQAAQRDSIVRNVLLPKSILLTREGLSTSDAELHELTPRSLQPARAGSAGSTVGPVFKPMASVLAPSATRFRPLTPSRESDLVAGSESLIKGSGPDSFMLRARIGAGYSSMSLDHDLIGFRIDSILDDPLELHGRGYQAGASDFTRDNLIATSRQAPPDLLGEVTIGDRVLEKRLGLILAGSLEQTYRYTEATRNYDAVDADNRVYLIRRQNRMQGRERAKYAASGRLDYQWDERNGIDLTLTGVLQRNSEIRVLADTNDVSLPVLNTISTTGFQQRMLGEISIGGRHRFDSVELTWRGGYAKVRQEQPTAQS